MFKQLSNKIKYLITSLIVIIILIFTIGLFQNNTTMIIQMNAEKRNVLNPQFYFTTEGIPFNENNSRRAFQIKNNSYYFSLPDTNKIQYVRFDPTTSLDIIHIQNITIISTHWFTTSYYSLELTKLKPLHDIINMTKTSTELTFQTNGRDSQFNIQFILTKKYASSDKHLKSLVVAILIYLVLAFLFNLYLKSTEDNRSTTYVKLILYSLFLVFAIFKVNYYSDNVKRFNPPDELAHLAYIDYIHKHNETIPKFEHMRMLNNKSAGNYLNHPPLYYHLMNMIYDENLHIYKNVNNFRDLNVLIFIGSFLLLLYLGFSSNINILGHFVYLTVITSIPMYAYSGGSITNDNMAVLGALTFIIGLKRLLEKNYTNITYIILGLGIFLAYFSKLTAAILIFFALIFFLINSLKVSNRFRTSKTQIGILVLFIIPILYYQFYIFTTYQSLMPSFHITYPEQFLESVYYVPEEHRQHLSILEWVDRMRMYISGGWFGIHSHHSFTKNNIFEYLGLFSLHVMAIMAMFFHCTTRSKTYCTLGKIGILSLLMVLIVQFIFSYKTHISNGYMGGLQPRYLLPFMFSFAIMASLFVERFKQYFLFNILIIVICIHAIYSDFFYFLKYYQ